MYLRVDMGCTPMVEPCMLESLSTVNKFVQVYNAIFGRLGNDTKHIPDNSVQVLFNDMKLYPTPTEVSEMLQCARQFRRGDGKYLTIGEFCVITSEMQKQQKSEQQPQEEKCLTNCEVFLGGSCNPTTWRTDIAIPELKRQGITYYNPQVSMWAPELVAQEYNAKQSASLLLFVVDSQTRSVAGMIEVAYLVADNRCVVLVAYPYREGQKIMDELITIREYLDLVEAQTSLLALVKDQGVKVHSTLASALDTTTSYLRSGANKLKKLTEVFESYDEHRTGEIKLKDAADAYTRLTGQTIDMQQFSRYLNTNSKDVANVRINFEHFCALYAEFSRYHESAVNGWKSQPAIRPNGVMKNTTSRPTPYEYDIYLGGSLSKATWRDEAVKILEQKGITYFNPIAASQISTASDASTLQEITVLEWKKAMDLSSVLLFYVTNDTRSLTTMILAAHCIGRHKEKVVLCINDLPQNEDSLVVDGEMLSKQAIKDYNRGRVYLSDLAERNEVPVFQDIEEALQCAIQKCVIEKR